jgi:hypothetical protein
LNLFVDILNFAGIILDSLVASAIGSGVCSVGICCAHDFLQQLHYSMHFQSSFIGAIAIGDLIRTTLGPKGMVSHFILVTEVFSFNAHYSLMSYSASWLYMIMII